MLSTAQLISPAEDVSALLVQSRALLMWLCSHKKHFVARVDLNFSLNVSRRLIHVSLHPALHQG